MRRRRIADIEYAQMLLSRYTIAQLRQDGGLDRSAYVVLARLASDGPLSIAELSDLLRLDTSTLQRQTTAALRVGLVDRIPDPDGGAARKLTLTDEGRARLDATRERSLHALEKILDEWTDDDIDRFADLLHRFNDAIESYGPGSPKD
ncbi:MAG: MarR family transcriptional regulator [Microbacterium sp.]|jgi:DNA-binding MarR family transcriptional regulator|uniref:MarR family winged helix-turn-helix transcriptional regulator n=1 Tax=Microbacterium sp. TaxID=51671 RepID=UPI002819B74A|nr:MarR family transcriptional regulator [Microbacterium sp.]MDR2320057.1 MarR family transcriptional regulator [Microbacterium sp.]